MNGGWYPFSCVSFRVLVLLMLLVRPVFFLLWNTAAVHKITTTEILKQQQKILRRSITNEFKAKHAANWYFLKHDCFLTVEWLVLQCLVTSDSRQLIKMTDVLWVTLHPQQRGWRVGRATSEATSCLITTSDIYMHDLKPSYITALVSKFSLCQSHWAKSKNIIS